MQTAPIALFVYNRPDHTRRVVESLRRNVLAPESDLHVFSDGARTQEAAGRVNEVREYVKCIDGFANVSIHEKDHNHGLANSVIEGVSHLCDVYGKVIVVEDDLLTAPHFLGYMNSAITRYREDEQVMQISGHMFPVNVCVEQDAFFLPFTTSWGWATWARAWQKFDPLAGGYDQLRNDSSRRHSFDLNGGYGYFSMLEAQLRGELDSWAIRWYLSVFLNDGLVLYPEHSLVENIGFDGSGTHCRGEALDQAVDVDFVPRVFPSPGIDLEARDKVFAYFRARNTPISRLRRLMGRLFG